MDWSDLRMSSWLKEKGVVATSFFRNQNCWNLVVSNKSIDDDSLFKALHIDHIHAIPPETEDGEREVFDCRLADAAFAEISQQPKSPSSQVYIMNL